MKTILTKPHLTDLKAIWDDEKMKIYEWTAGNMRQESKQQQQPSSSLRFPGRPDTHCKIDAMRKVEEINRPRNMQ